MFNFNDAKTRVILSLTVLLLGVGGLAFSFYKEVLNIQNNPQQVVEKEVKDVVSMVGKHMILPENEVPTVATVSDPEALKNQPFFANAKIGDRVLIYATALRAILYDPSLDKIKEVAPLNIGNK